MNDWASVFEPRCLLAGTCAIDETHFGAPVDISGFNDVLAVISIGAIGGSGGNTGTFTVKFQEGASAASTGSAFADIDDGAVNGTMTADLAVTALSTPNRTIAIYERFDDSKRSAFIRPHVSLVGTDSVNVAYTVTLLMGRPRDTGSYITDAGVQGTGNAEFSDGVS